MRCLCGRRATSLFDSRAVEEYWKVHDRIRTKDLCLQRNLHDNLPSLNGSDSTFVILNEPSRSPS